MHETNHGYSTTKMLIKLDGLDPFLNEEGKISDEFKFNINNSTFKIQNSKFPCNRDDKFETVLFLPQGEGRRGEGGLRTKGFFKFSYKFVDNQWFLTDLEGNPLKPAPEDSKQKINNYVNSLTKNDAQKITELPLITVITVVLNGEKYLEQTIQSVIHQTYPNVEYIIIDGGSTDGTLDIIKKYEDKIDYWVSEKDRGISDAFNKGIICAIGDVIGIINSDDWYEQHTIVRIVNYFIINPEIDIVCGKLRYWNENMEDFIFDSNPSKLIYEMTVNHPTVFVKSKIYKKHGLFSYDYKYAMDYELLLRFYVNGIKIGYLDDILSNMRLEGVSARNWIKAYNEVRKAKLIHLKSFFGANLYFLFQLFRSCIRGILDEVGLSIIVTMYRKYFSLIKKEKNIF